MFKKKRYTIILAAALVLAVAVSGAAMATTKSSPDQDKANLFQDFLGKFAANLGVDQDKVLEALNTTKQQMLDEAVQQGKLTREQADKIAAHEDGGIGWFGRFHDMNGKHDFIGIGRGNDNIANALGMTREELKSELQAGKTMNDILAEHGMTTEQLHQKMVELKKELLSKAVADGKLTQEQADKLIQKMEQQKNNPAPQKGN
ncbi:MAG: DUF2680 domain-containing protein [Bacillota bacterium]